MHRGTRQRNSVGNPHIFILLLQNLLSIIFAFLSYSNDEKSNDKISSDKNACLTTSNKKRIKMKKTTAIMLKAVTSNYEYVLNNYFSILYTFFWYKKIWWKMEYILFHCIFEIIVWLSRFFEKGLILTFLNIGHFHHSEKCDDCFIFIIRYDIWTKLKFGFYMELLYSYSKKKIVEIFIHFLQLWPCLPSQSCRFEKIFNSFRYCEFLREG